jgi:uncharacterized ion transporter superfamily protein YfcC
MAGAADAQELARQSAAEAMTMAQGFDDILTFTSAEYAAALRTLE